MECLKLYHDLALLSSRIPVPFLAHFFARFDPSKSKSLASSVQHFHLRDLESADYRSAYHMLCDWFYGWNVTDVAADIGTGGGASNAAANAAGASNTEHFRMRRVPRDIDVREEGERVECERICKTYETLFNMSRRVLKRYYIEIEGMVPNIGRNAHDKTAREMGHTVDEGEGMDDVEKIWAQQRKASLRDSFLDETDAGEDSANAELNDLDHDNMLRRTRPSGMVVRRKTAVADAGKSSKREDGISDELQADGDDPKKRETNGSPLSSTDLLQTNGLAPILSENDQERKNLDPGLYMSGTELNSKPESVRAGVLYEALDENDVQRALQSDINQVYVQVDRATDYTLVCLSTVFCILSFAQILGNQETYIRFASQAQEVSTEFVSNNLKTVWDLLNRELPTEMSLQDIRHPELLKAKIDKVVDLRKTGSGRPPKYRWRKLHRKFALLHDLFTSVDVHLFPNFCVAHRDGVKAAKFSTFDSSLWLTGGYDCIIRIHDIRPPPNGPPGLIPNTNQVAASAGGMAGSAPVGTPSGSAAEKVVLVGPAGGVTGHNCLSQYVGHKSIVTDVHFTRDDTYIVSSSFDRTLKIWNAQSASCERTLNGHTDSVTSCDVTVDGRYIASASTDCSVRLWDFNNGECVAVIKKHTRWVKVVRFSHDGRYLMTGGLDKRIYVWDLKILINSRAITHTRCIEAHSDYILDMATARPALLATTSRDSTVRLFDYVTGQESAVFDMAPTWACTLCFSEDGQYLATGSFDNTISIFHVRDSSRVRQLRVLNLGILCVRFPKDLSYLAVGSTEGFLQQIPL
ncbi:WD40-repeat-containing domain protein [Phlyctochytrium arcticum]|nr:WD40-repeat-containing domain protein [Phlyctochytrium arcticum]